MKVVVWVVSILLAVAFVAVGGMKILTPAATLEQSAQGVPVALLKIAGTAEILGGLGLILPSVTRILPGLTPLAAAGLSATMLGATVTNIVVGSYSALPMTVILGVAAVFVGVARSGRHRIQPRSHAAGSPAALAG